MRDVVRGETVRVLIDDRGVGRGGARLLPPRHAGSRRARSNCSPGPGALFDLYDLEDEIDKLTSPRVPLPSGGWITIEGTEALTAVDVNSGSFTASTGLEETSAKVNLEAADEIGRQVRLRGIGGLIVVDFIHLDDPDNIAKVLAVLEASLSQGSHADADLADVGIRPGGDHAQARARSAGEADERMLPHLFRSRPQAHARQRGARSHAPRRKSGRCRARQADRRSRGAGSRALAGRSRRGGHGRARPARRRRACAFEAE